MRRLLAWMVVLVWVRIWGLILGLAWMLLESIDTKDKPSHQLKHALHIQIEELRIANRHIGRMLDKAAADAAAAGMDGGIGVGQDMGLDSGAGMDAWLILSGSSSLTVLRATSAAEGSRSIRSSCPSTPRL
jgi:hypothetical protein